MIWTKFTVDTTTEAEDLVSDFLNDMGVEGVMIEDNVPLTEEEIAEMFVDIPLVGEDDGTAKVSCFLPEGFDIDNLTRSVTEELKRLSGFINVGSGAISTEPTTDDSTWQNNWKEFFKPFRLYDDIVILPNWMTWDEIKDTDTVVRIESVMAFGTGAHETTNLCIGQIKKYLKNGDSIFDIGCGSGILSMIGVYLGAGYVKGIDIDPQAIKSSHENAAVNGFSEDRIDFEVGNLLADDSASNGSDNGSADAKYDIVVANILADVIIPLSSKVRPFMKEGGLFITSGIIDEKEDEVREALLKNGFEIIDTVHLNEWVCFVAR